MEEEEEAPAAPQTSAIFEAYKARILPPFCEAPCPKEKKCGVCELWWQIEYSLHQMNLKFTDNVIRTPILANRYILMSPTFITLRDLFFIYTSRFNFMYSVFREHPDFPGKKIIEDAIEKMVSIFHNPVSTIDEIVAIMEETILYAEAVMSGFNREIYLDNLHVFRTIKVIESPFIVPTTAFEKELLDQIKTKLPNAEPSSKRPLPLENQQAEKMEEADHDSKRQRLGDTLVINA